MSQENVELVRAALAAWNRGDYAAALEHVAPEIKTESHLGDTFAETYEGIAGMQRYFAGFWSSFADFHTEIDECIAGATACAKNAVLPLAGYCRRVDLRRRNKAAGRKERRA
jgi:ketosteroid isomerase-like protein